MNIHTIVLTSGLKWDNYLLEQFDLLKIDLSIDDIVDFPFTCYCKSIVIFHYSPSIFGRMVKLLKDPNGMALVKLRTLGNVILEIKQIEKDGKELSYKFQEEFKEVYYLSKLTKNE